MRIHPHEYRLRLWTVLAIGLGAISLWGCSGDKSVSSFYDAANDSSNGGPEAGPVTDSAAPDSSGSVDATLDGSTNDSSVDGTLEAATALDGAADAREIGDASNASDVVQVEGGPALGDAGPLLCAQVQCGANQKFCGVCVSTLTPQNGCAVPGACSSCSLPNASSTCSAQGTCAILSCRPGYADCNGDPTDGCEADLSAPSTCSACNVQCGATQVCSPSGCTGACAPPLTACGGHCLNLESDPRACGSCTMACSAPTGSFPTCANAACASACFTCPSDGGTTCPDLSNDPQNCGACGSVCPGSPGVCVNATCNGSVCGPGYTACQRGCTALSVDPSNCGACGHACSSTEFCQLGTCTAFSDLWLVTGLTTPAGLAVDETNVYFSDTGQGTVAAVPKAGGPVTTLATGQASPGYLAVGGLYVYWSNNLGGAVMRTLKDGTGTPSVLAAANQPAGLVVDPTSVYWVEQQFPFDLKSATLDGGTTLTLAQLNNVGGTSAGPLVTDGTLLYTRVISVNSVSDGVGSFSKAGDYALHFSGYDIGPLAASPATLAFEELFRGSLPSVAWYSLPGYTLLGGASASEGNINGAQGVAVNGCAVLWTTGIPDYPNSTGLILAAPLATDVPIPLVTFPASAAPTPTTIVADDTAAYFFSGTADAGALGRVLLP